MNIQKALLIPLFGLLFAACKFDFSYDCNVCPKDDDEEELSQFLPESYQPIVGDGDSLTGLWVSIASPGDIEQPLMPLSIDQEITIEDEEIWPANQPFQANITVSAQMRSLCHFIKNPNEADSYDVSCELGQDGQMVMYDRQNSEIILSEGNKLTVNDKLTGISGSLTTQVGEGAENEVSTTFNLIRVGDAADSFGTLSLTVDGEDKTPEAIDAFTETQLDYKITIPELKINKAGSTKFAQVNADTKALVFNTENWTENLSSSLAKVEIRLKAEVKIDDDLILQDQLVLLSHYIGDNDDEESSDTSLRYNLQASTVDSYKSTFKGTHAESPNEEFSGEISIAF